MFRRQVSQLFLVGFAATAICFQFVGVISPGWLCLSVTYKNFSDIDIQRWADDFDKSDLVSDQNFNNILDTVAPEDNDRVRRQTDRKPPLSPAMNVTSTSKRGNFTMASPAKQKEVYDSFLRWMQKHNITDPKLPSNFTGFVKYLYSQEDKKLYRTMQGLFRKFINSSRGDPQTNTRLYLSVIQIWLRGGADRTKDSFEMLQLPAQSDTSVDIRTQSLIYMHFKSYVAPTIDDMLPKNFTRFINWMSKNKTRLENMEIRYEYFMENVNDSKVEIYSNVIESWFEKASGKMKADKQETQFIRALALLAGVEWHVRLGVWYGRECLVFRDSTEDKCTSTDAVQIENNGLDVGGMATWNDLRVETIIGLCAGAIGLVGTALTMKPICLKGRQRVTTVVGICGMALSCILFLVPIIRIAGINSTINRSNLSHHDEVHLQMPWAAAVSGIGACLALVTAGLLAFYTWADEGQKWKKFDDDPPIVFTNEGQEKKTTLDTGGEGTGNNEDTYDNLANINNM